MKLDGKRVAILATDGFEQSELISPRKALLEAGAKVEVVSPENDSIKGWSKGEWAEPIKVNKRLEEADPSDYDALVLPGGVINPDKLRDNEKAVAFVRSFFSDGSQRPVAAICHGPQILINADVLDDRKLTSWSSIRKDLENAGATWADEQVVVDQGLVTSRSPDDLEAFNDKMIEEIAEGVHHNSHIHEGASLQ